MEYEIISLGIVGYGLALILMNMAPPHLRIVIGFTYVLFMGGAAYDKEREESPQVPADSIATQIVTEE